MTLIGTMLRNSSIDPSMDVNQSNMLRITSVLIVDYCIIYDVLGYLIIQKDVSKMAKAYVSDIALLLNCANKENKVILDSVDLI